MAQWLASETAMGRGRRWQGGRGFEIFRTARVESGVGRREKDGSLRPMGRWDLTSGAVSVCGRGESSSPTCR